MKYPSVVAPYSGSSISKKTKSHVLALQSCQVETESLFVLTKRQISTLWAVPLASICLGLDHRGSAFSRSIVDHLLPGSLLLILWDETQMFGSRMRNV